MDTLRGLFADGIVWHDNGSSPLAGEYKGQDEVFGLFGRLMQEMDSFRIEIHDLLANDTHGVALVQTLAERDGKHAEGNAAQIFHFGADGLVTEFWDFPDPASLAAFEALFD